MRGIIDVMGPVMIGPSSSHTLGAIRIGQFMNNMLEGIPEKVIFHLHQSFAETCKGHGTDRALLAGIMGFKEYDPRVRDSIEIARNYGINYTFVKDDLGEVHPNTVRIEAWRGHIYHDIVASSIGAGMVRFIRINGIDCDLSGEYHTLIITNKDIQGALERILDMIKVNVANLYLRRISAMSKNALTIIELDEKMNRKDLDEIKSLDVVEEAYYVESVGEKL
jgi:L-serine dehydratase